MLQNIALAAIVAQAALVSQTMGHGNIIVPKPTGDSDHVYYYGGPAGEIDMPEIVGSSSYGDYYKAVDTWFTDNSIASVKDFFTKYGSFDECGNTEKAGDPQPVPSDGYAQHDTLGSSHVGPCEIWCDETRVFHSTNCQADFAGESPAKIPIDVATCESSSEFVFYWLALHAQPWQAYVNCVALSGSGASSSNSTTTTTAPATTTAAPTATTVAPSTTTSAPATDASVDEETEAPAATTEAPADEADTETEAPAATTAAPAASSDKCSVRRKRN